MSHRLPAWQPAKPPLSHTPAYQHYHTDDHLNLHPDLHPKAPLCRSALHGVIRRWCLDAGTMGGAGEVCCLDNSSCWRGMRKEDSSTPQAFVLPIEGLKSSMADDHGN